MLKNFQLFYIKHCVPLVYFKSKIIGIYKTTHIGTNE